MKTGGTAPSICRTPNLRKTSNIHTIFNIRKTLNLYITLLLLDDRSRTYKVSKVRKDKAYRPILDIEEVTVLLSTNTKA